MVIEWYTHSRPVQVEETRKKKHPVCPLNLNNLDGHGAGSKNEGVDGTGSPTLGTVNKTTPVLPLGLQTKIMTTV